jgi:hypothetical protein
MHNRWYSVGLFVDYNQIHDIRGTQLTIKEFSKERYYNIMGMEARLHSKYSYTMDMEAWLHRTMTSWIRKLGYTEL